MTSHYFENLLVKLHYYKYGNGPNAMLCFHGYGMHGKQFRILEEKLGAKYTFYGFDLFFHKETKLVNQSLEHIKRGISKKKLAELFIQFCAHEHIGQFSVIGYSMGTHYATAIVEQLAQRINEYIVAAPSALNPGVLIRFFSTNKIGNKIIEKLAHSDKAILHFLDFYRKLKLIDSKNHEILLNEIGTRELRLDFYASLTYLRFLDTDFVQLEQSLQQHQVKSIFVFGKRDKMYPKKIGNFLIPKLKSAEVIVLDENHELINKNFADTLSAILA